MRETTHRCNCLLCYVVFSRCIIFDNFVVLCMDAPTNTVNFLVSIYTVMVTTLPSTRHGETHTRWMPCSNTGNLTETFVGFPRQLLSSPSESHPYESLSFGNTNDIDHLILTKYRAHGYRFLQMFLCPIDFISDASTVDLQFHYVSFLLFQSNQFLLGVY